MEVVVITSILREIKSSEADLVDGKRFPGSVIMTRGLFVFASGRRHQQTAGWNLPRKELDFWRTKRSVEVIVKGKKKTFYQYKADTNMPRPEAFCQDVDLVKNMTDPKEKAKVWRNIASASESGWDFSSRWIRKDEGDKASPWKLTNLMTTRIVPMDLNALMCGNMEMLAHLYLQIGDKAKSRAYHGKYQLFMEDFKSLFYKKEHGIWYDYNMDSGTLNEAFYGSAAMPLFVRCYDTIDLGTAERMFQRLELFDKQHKLLGHPFGVPVSITVNSSQQWDFPNILPPSQHMLIEGLRRSSNRRMEEKAKEMAQKWVFANYNLFQNCLRQMWEKITADTGTPGSGGEYNAQMGFGWTNGAMLDLLVTYGDVLKLKDVPEIRCGLKDLVQEPEHYPNNVKGIKTDSKDPRAYVSAQYTLECSPPANRKGCNGTDPIEAWRLYRKAIKFYWPFESGVN
uniref:Trehalase n=1 Tax=Globodera pallida TaxID=36090 RepID=A0A183CBB9_GLOPA